MSKKVVDAVPEKLTGTLKVKLGRAVMWSIPNFGMTELPRSPVGAARGLLLTRSAPGPIELDMEKLTEGQQLMVKVALENEEIVPADSEILVPVSREVVEQLIADNNVVEYRKQLDNLMRLCDFNTLSSLLRCELDKGDKQNRAAIVALKNSLRFIAESPTILKNNVLLAQFKEAMLQTVIKHSSQAIKPSQRK